MATPTLTDLLAPQTSDQAKATFLQRLAGTGFPVTTWQEGDAARTLVELFAYLLSLVITMLVAIAGGGFIDYATGSWLVLLAKQLYNLDQKQAVYAQGTCQIAAAATTAGYSIVAGQLVAKSASGLRYTNTNGGNLAAGGTLNLTFQAESPGSAYNVGNDSITVLVTPLPGVTIANPDPGSGTWITQVGTDVETDASLKARCKARWPSLGSKPTQDVFAAWAVEAAEEVTRTLVETDASTPGQVNVWLGSASGGVGSDVVADVQAFVEDRVGLASTCVIESAQDEAIQVNATIYVLNAYQLTAPAAAQAALEAYINAVAIKGVAYESEVFEQLQSPTGVRNVEISVLALASVGSGVGDVDLSALSGTPRVATPQVTITTVIV